MVGTDWSWLTLHLKTDLKSGLWLRFLMPSVAKFRVVSSPSQEITNTKSKTNKQKTNPQTNNNNKKATNQKNRIQKKHSEAGVKLNYWTTSSATWTFLFWEVKQFSYLDFCHADFGQLEFFFFFNYYRFSHRVQLVSKALAHPSRCIMLYRAFYFIYF